MGAKVCVACGKFAEPPFTFVEDSPGRVTGWVVCQGCLTAASGDDDLGKDAADFPAEFGGEGG